MADMQQDFQNNPIAGKLLAKPLILYGFAGKLPAFANNRIVELTKTYTAKVPA